MTVASYLHRAQTDPRAGAHEEELHGVEVLEVLASHLDNSAADDLLRVELEHRRPAVAHDDTRGQEPAGDDTEADDLADPGSHHGPDGCTGG